MRNMKSEVLLTTLALKSKVSGRPLEIIPSPPHLGYGRQFKKRLMRYSRVVGGREIWDH